MNPSDREGQKARQQILRKAGIDPKNQQMAVHTLHSLQNLLLVKTDEALRDHLLRWLPALREIKPEHFQGWMNENGYVLQAVKHTHDKISGKETMVWALYAQATSRREEVKKAFETNARILPILAGQGKGLFRLDFDHAEIQFPPDVKINKV